VRERERVRERDILKDKAYCDGLEICDSLWIVCARKKKKLGICSWQH
jgi:hypothetical protein